MTQRRVVIVMGGLSAERDVSLSSGRMAQAALDTGRYQLSTLDPAEPGWMSLLLAAPRPDAAVICLHGPGGEDGSIQGLLEWAGIPYTGPGVASSALCMDKELTKLVLRAHGIPAPQSLTVGAAERARSGFQEVVDSLPLPLVVKPNRQGSTRGTSKVDRREDALTAIDLALEYGSQALLEEFVSGVEITAAVVGGHNPDVLPLIEIVPSSGFYDYHDKYTPGAAEEIVPARISERQAEKARRYALLAHRALKCWGVSRTDMIVGDDEIWVLEVNTVPGMTGTSLLPRAAEAAGRSLGSVLEQLIELALARPEGW